MTANSMCGANGLIFFALDPAAIGYPAASQANAQIYLECDYWNYNSTINKNCWYMMTGPTDESGLTAYVGDLISGWHNGCTDSACTVPNPAVALSNNASTYFQATCR